MRFCHRCERELAATPEIFLRDKSRPLGLAYECRECHSERKRGRDRRPERWSNMTPEQRAKKTSLAKRYANTDKGRACFIRKNSERTDSCDMSTNEILAIIERPCHYCGTTEHRRGLDRIDNSKGHVKGNVLPACWSCNFARGNRFTVDEMMELGKTMRLIMDKRTKVVANEDRQDFSSTGHPIQFSPSLALPHQK